MALMDYVFQVSKENIKARHLATAMPESFTFSLFYNTVHIFIKNYKLNASDNASGAISANENG